MKLVQLLSGVLSVLLVTGCSEATDQPIKHDIVRPAKIFVVLEIIIILYTPINIYLAKKIYLIK